MNTKTVKPYKSRLDDGTAYWMARIAKAVYRRKAEDDPAPDADKILEELREGDPERDKDLKDPGFEKVITADHDSAQAALILHKYYACITFRGTDEPRDWLDNLNVVCDKTPLGECHRGFHRSCLDIWEPLHSAYLEIQAEDRTQRTHARPLFLTGHSLGGAMCTVAASLLIAKDKPFISAYTFGQPRAATSDMGLTFNNHAKERFFRFQNNNDIVTRTPPRLLGFTHVGSLLYIDEHQVIHNDTGFWYRFLDSVQGAVHAIPEKGLDAVEDHGMEHYLHAVQSWNTHLE